jgi:hypothetical protein
VGAGDRAGPRALAALFAADGPVAAEVDEIVAILERTGAREYTRDQAASTATRRCASSTPPASCDPRSAPPRADHRLGHHRLRSEPAGRA